MEAPIPPPLVTAMVLKLMMEGLVPFFSSGSAAVVDEGVTGAGWPVGGGCSLCAEGKEAQGSGDSEGRGKTHHGMLLWVEDERRFSVALRPCVQLKFTFAAIKP